ncbi:MAG: hypothetical protein CBB71_20070 [Rhodopirellula sp. TMED11]|nr:MAG: hypothetical protein CBB71_20070 [Rhodopirellula sp. TMED11]
MKSVRRCLPNAAFSQWSGQCNVSVIGRVRRLGPRIAQKAAWHNQAGNSYPVEGRITGRLTVNGQGDCADVGRFGQPDQ